MRLRWDRRALQDLRDIHSYVAANSSPGSAERVRRHLRSRTDLLASRPLLGVASSNPSIRVLFPTRYPYRIYLLSKVTRSSSCTSATRRGEPLTTCSLDGTDPRR